jgi:VanZ family protein
MPRHYPSRLMVLFPWLPPLVWSGVILLMSGDLGSAVYTWGLMAQLQAYFPFLKSVPTSELNHIARVAGHITAYGILMVLWLRAFRWQWPMHPICATLLSLVMTCLVASLDESRQSLHPSRTGKFSDVILDLSGALAAILVLCLYFLIRFRKNRQLHNPKK